jgi:hypothetical protein
LLVVSYFLFLIGGLVGYALNRFYGLVIFGSLGYLVGVWMRRSLGLRGRKTTTGFFQRMRERAQGARPGLLEWGLEKISGHEFTRSKCERVAQTHARAVKQLKQSGSSEEQNRILADLDQRVKKILYG